MQAESHPKNPSLVELTVSDGLAVIELANTDHLNAIDGPMAKQLLECVRRVANWPGVRLLLLRARGTSFGVGGNLEWFDVGGPGLHERAAETLEAVAGIIDGLRNMDAIVVAAVHGPVAGGSIGLMCAADFVIAHPGTRISMAYSRIGATPDAGTTWLLPRLLGERRALELMLLNNVIDAQEARSLGLVNAVVESEDFNSADSAIVQRLLNGPTRANATAKALVYGAAGRTLTVQLAAEREAFLATIQTEDFRVGVESFLRKQRPVFRGR